jgi:two-component system sensor histidine kinase DegS
VQEALNNVIKHAEAKIVKIRLRFSSDAVDVQVSDDGHGFDPQARGSGGRVSWGLRNMEERATLLGGKFQVRSSPGRGTTLDVSVPYVPGNEVSNDNPSASGG